MRRERAVAKRCRKNDGVSIEMANQGRSVFKSRETNVRVAGSTRTVYPR